MARKQSEVAKLRREVKNLRLWLREVQDTARTSSMSDAWYDRERWLEHMKNRCANYATLGLDGVEHNDLYESE